MRGDANGIAQEGGPEELRRVFDEGFQLRRSLNPKGRQDTNETSASNTQRGKEDTAAALKRLVDEIARAQPESCKAKLNDAAFKMGSMAARGWITWPVIKHALFQAARACGLVAQEGDVLVSATLKTGFDAGFRRPAKDRRERRRSHKSSAAGGGVQREEAFKIIKQLAGLSALEYEQQRPGAAQELKIRLSRLDKLVGHARTELESEPLYPHWAVNPSDCPVDGAVLIHDIVGRIQRHLMMTTEAAIITALWIVMTWVHDRAAIHSPILLVTSPEPNSGKTTLIGLLAFLARRSLPTVGITAAALYRSIEKWLPTIIVDEGDTVLVDNEDLRAVINSGWTRGQGVIRCDPDTHEPRLFKTFCPKAIGMKGQKLPDTTLSRTIIIEMVRKSPGERVTDFQHIDDNELAALRAKLLRWAEDNGQRLTQVEPDLPQGFENRRAANWRLLLAIAEAAGGDWPAKARAAAQTLSGMSESRSNGVKLLSDIKAIFEAIPERDCIASRELVEQLAADPESQWSEWGRDRKPISQKQLAGLLREYKIFSGTVHPAGARDAKGYQRIQFEEAWRRYLEPGISAAAAFGHFEASKRPNTDETGASSDF
jgi:putative DNA primase/helicase